MERAEATGLGLATAGHVALFALLSAGFATATRDTPVSPPMEVSFVEEVDLISSTPEPAAEAPAQSVAPDLGPPEESAPQPEPIPAPPEPLPPPPKPIEPAPPPKPQPIAKPAPPKPAPKPVRAPPKPKAAAKPAEKPASKASPPAPAKVKPAPTAAAKAASARGPAQQTRASRLGSDFLKGIGSDPTPSTSQKPTGAVMSSKARADIGSAITRQVQPCANQQVNPGPGAERIQVTINLKLNRDGSLAARPRIVDTRGVDDQNRRYADRVGDLAVATFVGCSPLRGLPAELYDVANGWSNFSLRYKLPD